eukprot:g2538.t1
MQPPSSRKEERTKDEDDRFANTVRTFYKHFAPTEDPESVIEMYRTRKEDLNAQLREKYGVDLHHAEVIAVEEVKDPVESEENTPVDVFGRPVVRKNSKEAHLRHKSSTLSPEKDTRNDDARGEDFDEGGEDGSIALASESTSKGETKSQIIRQVIMSVCMFVLLNCFVLGLNFFFDVSLIRVCRRACGRDDVDSGFNGDDAMYGRNEGGATEDGATKNEGREMYLDKLDLQVASFLKRNGVSAGRFAEQLWRSGFERWDSFQCATNEDLVHIGFKRGRAYLVVRELNRMAAAGDAPYRSLTMPQPSRRSKGATSTTAPTMIVTDSSGPFAEGSINRSNPPRPDGAGESEGTAKLRKRANEIKMKGGGALLAEPATEEKRTPVQKTTLQNVEKKNDSKKEKKKKRTRRKPRRKKERVRRYSYDRDTDDDSDSDTGENDRRREHRRRRREGTIKRGMRAIGRVYDNLTWG